MPQKPQKFKSPAKVPDKRPLGKSSKSVRVDVKKICSIDHECIGCSEVSKSCCARYDVCVTKAEMKKIVAVLPEAAEFARGLKTENGYANVFGEAEEGAHSIDTHENGLCVFAFKQKGLIRCSLHAVETKLGLPLGTVKPKVCILWPLTFNERGDTLTLHDDALGCACSSVRKKESDQISPDLRKTIEYFHGRSTNK